MSDIRVAPSILASDFAKLGEEVASVKNAGADILHVDIMDGHFVPNLSIGTPVVKSLRKTTDMFLDVHLMVTDPVEYGKIFFDAGADGLTFHIETVDDKAEEVIDLYRSFGVTVGISMNPDTPAESVKDYIEKVDLVLVMTVHPGFGGQKFIEDCLPKIEKISGWIKETGRDIALQVDGGIDTKTVTKATAAGANLLVAGTSVFKAEDRADVIRRLKS